MGNLRGLKNRLCPRCGTLTPHRTLYARVTVDGKRKWTGLFWACERCTSLNHVILPSYILGSASVTLPSPLAVAIVRALEQGPLDFNELVTDLRRKQPPLPGHVFKTAVALTLEFLRGHGVVVERPKDCTEEALEALRPRRLGVCPVESKRTLVSMYVQKQGSATNQPRFVSAGVYCTSCGYHQEHPV
jgi:hypothetical protein